MSRDALYLRHIQDAIAKIEEYVEVGRDTFMTETHWSDAVIRQLEIVGEATKQLSADMRANYPAVPWRRVAGLRDVLIHNYMGVDLVAVWEITQQTMPKLKDHIDVILAEDEETGRLPTDG
jgi:uncharacterized protein with HEPN domain